MRRAQHGHYETAKSLRRWHYAIGIPLVLSTGFVGASVFSTLERDVNPKFKILVSLVSLVALMLAGLQTFFRLEERAEKHRQAGSRYGALYRETDALALFSGGSGPDLQIFIERTTERLSLLSSTAPEIPPRVWEAMLLEISW